MRAVSGNGAAVDRALHAGTLACPRCGEALRPWGRARPRTIRMGTAAQRTVQPRRARCGSCGTTHVLLPEWMLPRRAYAARVVANVLAARSRGIGYRRIARRMRLPAATVRDWVHALPYLPLHHGAEPAPVAARNTSPRHPADMRLSARPP
ncbi:DUF6431 domain-containing protein [Actinoplanes sp. NPDC049316]|uniref:DUF6431 domain-containing protein n=1 Tax=Actinoplanes sp. NPDC049316 TaxID=3154727 RepID=UPI00341EF334